MRISLFAIGTFLMTLLPVQALCAEEAKKESPLCALLDPDKIDRVGLLEAKLLADPATKWVERNAIEKVLKEQQVQALFSGGGVGERAKLGRLLKADVLVMVRRVEYTKEPALEIVVSETAGGLRLLVRAVAESKDPTADVDALAAGVRAGLRKYAEKVREVIAVPPFVSTNVTFNYDYLKGAYAKLAEQVVLNREGVVAVELAEAEALATELKLGTSGQGIERQPPLYWLGEYRHDGIGAEQAVTLKLRAERAGKVVGKPLELKLKPDECAPTIKRWAIDSLDTALKVKSAQAQIDPKAEAKQLAERMAVFHRLGDWNESLALAEAALLLDPNWIELHVFSLKALIPQIRAAHGIVTANRKEIDRLALIYRRGLEHLEPLIRTGEIEKHRDRAGGTLLGDFQSSANYLVVTGQKTEEVEAQLIALKEEQVDLMVRLIPDLNKRDADMRYFKLALDYLPRDRKFKKLGEAILDLAHLPDAARQSMRLCDPSYFREENTAELKIMIDRLSKSPNRDIQQVASALKRRVDAMVPPAKQVVDPAPHKVDPALPASDAVSFKPVVMTLDSNPFKGTGVQGICGVVPCTPSVDVFLAYRALYLMTKKGALRKVWEGVELENPRFSSVQFDGKYVWCTVSRHRLPPLLLVLDIASGKIHDVSSTEGLPIAPKDVAAAPNARMSLLATPIKPGQACVTGSASGRNWVAIVTFDLASESAAARIIHEARETAERTDLLQWKNPKLAFNPTAMYSIHGKPDADGNTPCRVIIHRDNSNTQVAYHPLVIDPAKPEVGVFTDRLWPRRSLGGPTHLGVYMVEPQLTPDHSRHLVRVGFPGEAKEIVAKGLPKCEESFVAIHERQVHIVLINSVSEIVKSTKPSSPPVTKYTSVCQWWMTDEDGQNLRQIATNVSPIKVIGRSTHYGLVALVLDRTGQGGILHTVEIKEPNIKENK